MLETLLEWQAGDRDKTSILNPYAIHHAANYTLHATKKRRNHEARGCIATELELEIKQCQMPYDTEAGAAG